VSSTLIIVIVVFLAISTVVEIIVLTTRGGKKKASARGQAEATNIARKVLDDIEFNRRELAMPTGVTSLAMKLENTDALLGSVEFAEKASRETLETLKAYRQYVNAVGSTAMVQRTSGGAPIVMSRVLAEDGREKFEQVSRAAEDAMQKYFDALG
jgi:4-hydroxy-L-threonine phosphate dehydrogenase PdxA